MKKFEGILICTDLDGTLLRSDHTISEKNMEAVSYFKSEGGLFTFVTGRLPFCATAYYTAIDPNAPFGCINGGGLYDHRAQEYMWKQPVSDIVLELVEFADKNLPGIGIQVSTFDKIYFCRENAAMADFREITGMPNLTCHYRDVKEPISKILFGDNDEERILRLDALLHAHPLAENFSFVRSEKALYEILPKDMHKGVSISNLVRLLHIDANKTVAIGDYYNDVHMLRTAHIGVAVENACPEAKEAADYITVANDADAIARIIEDIDTGILKI